MHSHSDQPRRNVQLRPALRSFDAAGELDVISSRGFQVASLRPLAEGECQLALEGPEALPVASAHWEITIGRESHLLFLCSAPHDPARLDAGELAPWASLVTEVICAGEPNRG